MGSLHCTELSRDGGRNRGAGGAHASTEYQIKQTQNTFCSDPKRQRRGSLGNCVHVIMRTVCGDATLYPLRPQEAVSAATDEERLVKIHNVIQQLPPPHYRSRLRLTVAPWWTEAEAHHSWATCCDACFTLV